MKNISTNLLFLVYITDALNTKQAYHLLSTEVLELEQQQHLRNKNHENTLTQIKKATDDSQANIINFQKSIEETNTAIDTMRSTVSDLQTEIKLLEVKNDNLDRDVEIQKDEQTLMSEELRKFVEATAEIQRDYEKNEKAIAEYKDSISICSQSMQLFQNRRDQDVQKAILLSLLWSVKLEMVEQGLIKEAMKQFGIHAVVSIAIWGCGIGLACKGVQIAAGVGKWIYRIASASHGPIAALMTDDTPKRMKQVVQIHVENQKLLLGQYTETELTKAHETMGIDETFEVHTWRDKNQDNMAIYSICDKSMQMMLEQDMKKETGKPKLLHLLDAPPK